MLYKIHTIIYAYVYVCILYNTALFLKKEVYKTDDISWFEEPGFQQVKALSMLINIGRN